jgi:hypothetical protein
LLDESAPALAPASTSVRVWVEAGAVSAAGVDAEVSVRVGVEVGVVAGAAGGVVTEL